MDINQMQAQLDALRAENAALKIKRQPKISVKVSQKGAVSVYGLGRFPVTLYRSQWERLNAAMPGVLEFITANADSLTTKE